MTPWSRRSRSNSRPGPRPTCYDLEGLKKRAADLEKEVNRLVKAIRTIDAAELVEELSLVQAERGRVKARLLEASKLTTLGIWIPKRSGSPTVYGRSANT